MAAVNSMEAEPGTLFAGCEPAVLADAGGWIVAAGGAALARRDRVETVVELEGRALPGLGDAHLHLHDLAGMRLGLDLRSASSPGEVLERVRVARPRGPQGWILGGGWSQSLWRDRGAPTREMLDEAADGRPVLLHSRDEHSAWASTTALELAGITSESIDPPGGLVERGTDRAPTGVVRECLGLFSRVVPSPDALEYREEVHRVLVELAAMGLCSVHSMDPPETFSALQQLHDERRLPLRVTYNLPASHLHQARDLGLRQGLGDEWLRVRGVKAFLDGSLGSGTAEMLGGGGIARLSNSELDDLVGDCAEAGLSPCLHAIGDRAVHRALVALERRVGSFPGWRPRIEHAQLVHPDDLPRFRAAGAVASMQPAHAVADRELAERTWAGRTGDAYAWSTLLDAGARLAFGSDAPVESADPILGLRAATEWRQQAGWHPRLALSSEQALHAYSEGVAYAAGLEREQGRIAPGYRCDLTVLRAGRVVATVVGGRLVR